MWVKVHGPAATNRLGADSYTIESAHDVQVDEEGTLVILTAPLPARPGIPGIAPASRARSATRVVYPKWGWNKTVTGETIPRGDGE